MKLYQLPKVMANRDGLRDSRNLVLLAYLNDYTHTYIYISSSCRAASTDNIYTYIYIYIYVHTGYFRKFSLISF